MAKIIAMFNFKGGVGKTSSTAALGSLFSRAGNRVLMVDLDAQTNLTYSFFDPAATRFSRTVMDAFRDRNAVPTVAVREDLYLCPSNLGLILSSREANFAHKREFILADALSPVADRFDLILLDCPPSASIVTENALAVADRVCVPMMADQYSYYGLKMLDAYVQSQKVINPGLKIDDIFFTFFNPREKQAKDIVQLVSDEYGRVVLDSRIRRSVSVAQSVPRLGSVVDVFPLHPVSDDYRALAKELFDRLSGNFGKEV